jgi:tetratricopeptide (TPR) repeat protein
VTHDPIESAVAEWLELWAAGTPPELTAFAQRKGIPVDALRPVLDNARWLVGRHQATRETAPPALPVPPFQLDGVSVLAEAGRGGMGVVFKGIEEAQGRTVAVKILAPAARGTGSQGRTRFLKEARAAARLSHPNLVRIFQVGETGGLAWFTMEWIEGETLAQILARHAGEPDRRGAGHRFREVAALIARVARGLQHAHDSGLLHRDVKPGNILVDTEGEPHLADFGLVRDLAEETLTGTGEVLGSPPYMSPEQVRGDRAPTQRIDVYGLGVTLYECLALRRPFHGEDQETLRAQILQAPLVPPRSHDPNVPAALQWICLRAMAREPEVRYPSAAALAADLEAFLRDEPVTAGPPSTALRVQRWVRRHGRGLFAATALLLFAGVAVFAWRSRLHLAAAELKSTHDRVAMARLTEDRGQLLDVLDAAVASHPAEPAFLLQRAIPRLATGQLAMATLDIARARALRPADPEIVVLAQALAAAGAIAAGQPLAAEHEAAFQRVAAMDSREGLHIHLCGAILCQLGRWQQAEPFLRRASERDRSLGAEVDLMTAYQRIGRIDDAWAALDRFCGSRESPLLGYHRCRLAVGYTDAARAKAELRALERRAPASAFTATARILLHMLQGDQIEEGEAEFARARAANDWAAAATFAEDAMAKAYHVGGRPGKAIPLWESLLQRWPRNVNYRSLLGITLLQLQHRRRGAEQRELKRRGLAELERAAEDSQHIPSEGPYHRGLFLFYSDRLAEAVASLRAATAAAPLEPHRWRPLAYALVTLAGETSDPAERLRLIEEYAAAQGREAELKPWDAKAQDFHRAALLRLAEAYAAMGDAREEAARRQLTELTSRPAR